MSNIILTGADGWIVGLFSVALTLITIFYHFKMDDILNVKSSIESILNLIDEFPNQVDDGYLDQFLKDNAPNKDIYCSFMQTKLSHYIKSLEQKSTELEDYLVKLNIDSSITRNILTNIKDVKFSLNRLDLALTIREINLIRIRKNESVDYLFKLINTVIKYHKSFKTDTNNIRLICNSLINYKNLLDLSKTFYNNIDIKQEEKISSDTAIDSENWYALKDIQKAYYPKVKKYKIYPTSYFKDEALKYNESLEDAAIKQAVKNYALRFKESKNIYIKDKNKIFVKLSNKK